MPHAAVAVDPRSRVLRPDPLAAAYARGRISEAQYAAGREFQRIYHLADRRRPDQLDGLDANQLKAWQALTRTYQTLGLDGSAIVCAILIEGQSAKEIAASRGQTGPQAEKFFRMRFRECLATLAQVLGFAHSVEIKSR